MTARAGARARATLAFFVVTLAPGACAGPGRGLSAAELSTIAHSSTVQLYGAEGSSDRGGSGVVYDARRGLVLTNAHVVAGLSGLTARVLDKADVGAQVVGTSWCDDIAVVKLETVPKGLKAVAFADSGKVKRADTVAAAGYPETLSPTGWILDKGPVRLAKGTVALPNVAGEPDASEPRYPSLIQHSALISPGHSGGPLLDEEGRLVGLNTVGKSRQQVRVQGQNFAISINTVKPMLGQLEAGASRADAGWDLAPFADVELLSSFQATGYGTAAHGAAVDRILALSGADGLLVFGVSPGSAAAGAGIEGGDLVTTLNGVAVTSVAQVCDVLGEVGTGGDVVVQGLHLARPGAATDPLGQASTSKLTIR